MARIANVGPFTLTEAREKLQEISSKSLDGVYVDEEAFVKENAGHMSRTSADPHAVEIVEVSRWRSPIAWKEVVITRHSGSNAELRLVFRGRDAFIGRSIAILIHCDDISDLSVKWVSWSKLYVEGKFQDLSTLNAIGTLVEHADRGATLKIKSLLGLLV